MQQPSDDEVATRSAKLRGFYARYVAVSGGARDPRIEQAFAAVPREPFAGPAPWHILAARPGGTGYLETPDADPAFLYQDVLVALDQARGINIGQPTAHVSWLDALAVQDGETVVQVGAGSGYYTSILAHLVGSAGKVHAFEIDPAMAERARRNLAGLPSVTLHDRSGIAEDLPKADAIYVNAGITQPSWAWLDALRPSGRLLFPLQQVRGFGGMLLVRKPVEGGMAWPARFVGRAGFIACQARQDDETGRALAKAFAGGGWETVRSLRLNKKPDKTCWLKGDDWWLSTDPAPDQGA